MSRPIDWSKPLEAYHPDGRVVEVGLAAGFCIRNRPEATPSPELVERMVEAFCKTQLELERITESRATHFGIVGELVVENRAILAALKPKPADPVREGFVRSIEGARCPLHIDSLTGLPLGTQCEALYDALIPQLAKHGLTITRKGEEG